MPTDFVIRSVVGGDLSDTGASRIATKIVCTVGPASNSRVILSKMIHAGADVLRLNFAHGTQEEQSRDIRTIREVSRRLQHPVAILQDLPGPKLRVGKLSLEPLHLKRHDQVTLTTKAASAKAKIPISYPGLPKAVKKGDAIFLADGSIRIEVLRTSRDEVLGRVLNGGDLTSGKGVNLPRLRMRLPAVTEEDKKHLQFGLEQGTDIIGVSFVQKPEDIAAARKAAADFGHRVFVIAKIEKREAVENLESIVREADGVMVARGDLGVELTIERVPIIQKRIIHEANKAGKPVITATQMLESMVTQPSPTRAEVADVANAIIDGTDAVMLSEETAVGKYPLEAVEVLSRVAHETEKYLPQEITPARRAWHERSQEDALALAGCETALEVSASAIVTPTRSGQTARRVSKYHPSLPIVALTPSEKVQRQLNLSWGVRALLGPEGDSMEAIFHNAERAIKSLGYAKKGDRIVIVAGDPKGPTGRTDLVKVQTIS
ncbi:pyruvate kinase [Candidatus Bathyarchaeota archaeon]|nr:MAG: pyruvate kinase [Candidatus Bathyarchaeota archaeon]